MSVHINVYPIMDEENDICCICLTESSRDVELDDVEDSGTVHSTTEYLYSDGFDWTQLSDEIQALFAMGVPAESPNLRAFSGVLKEKL